MRHTRNERAVPLFCIAAGLGILSLLFLGRDGFLSEQLADWRTPAMLAELLVFGVLFFLTDRMIPALRTKCGVLLFLVCLFLWIHRIFLPVLVSGMWCGVLILAGEDLLLPLRRREGIRTAAGMRRLLHDFLSGSSAFLILLCFLSGLHCGGTGTARKAALFTAVLSALVFLFFRVSGQFPVPAEYLPAESEREKDGERGTEAERNRIGADTLFLLLLLMIHAGRMNITLDYDSMRYGLRSFYIFDNGTGFFENLGLVNTVYYYPKGLEILTLPLSGTATYGFVLAFSFWTAVLLLFLIRDTAGRLFGAAAGRTAMLFTACIPGIMNLSTSAKTDMITLLIQMAAVSDMLFSVTAETEEEQSRAFLWNLAALAFTLTLKPTAIVFSGVLCLTGIFFCVFQKRKERDGEKKRLLHSALRGLPDAVRGMWFPCLLSLTALFGVTLRTVHGTGYPLDTVFTGVWEKIGMHGKYPFLSQSVPNAAAGLTGAEQFRHFAERLFLFFLAPVGDDGLHILIAWGTVLFPVLLLAVLLRPADGAERKEETRTALLFLYCALAAQLVFDGISLCLLFQVDGNYYNLSYALAAVTAAACWKKYTGALKKAVLPAAVTAVFLMTITNWAGARGFTEPKLNHLGFYDHRSDAEDYMILTAKDPFYRYLVNAPRIRLLAMAEEPECWLFPCRTESYADLAGSGGNVRLVKTLNDFKDYLETAGITFLYAEAPFLASHGRAEEIIRFMNEDGSITPLISQEGCTLYEYHAGIRD